MYKGKANLTKRLLKELHINACSSIVCRRMGEHGNENFPSGTPKQAPK